MSLFHNFELQQQDHTISNMLYLVGLGLADERDITVKGLEVVKRAERVYLEAYTAVLLVDVQVLVSDNLYIMSIPARV
jgi:precorrin-3B methylase